MSEKYLFGAEVDKIQETLFRTAAQRQVVGGSRLLVDFGLTAARLAQEAYGATENDILATGGGNFRILFPSQVQAEQFSRDLADCYRLLLDASITVATPTPINSDFQAANERISREIHRLKRSQRSAVDSPHTPTTAFCESSGVGLAGSYKRLVAAEEPQYLADFAQRMGKAGNIRYEEQENIEEDDTTFLGGISQYFAGKQARLKKWRWANVDDVERIDGERANVAYLIADGNDMGKLFGHCDAPQLKELSEYLDKAIRQALAVDVNDTQAPIPALVERLQEADRLADGVLPLLPLILAGDEVFILLPAVYALDFARRFCLAFEHFMTQSPIVQELRRHRADLPQPTMAAAVVFCKGSYPYRLAYQYGNGLLKQAKQMAKIIGASSGEWHSSLAFGLIVGSELADGDTNGRAQYRPTLSPYWITADAPGPSTQEAGINLADLLIHRWLLHQIPNKRLAELRELYTPAVMPKDDDVRRQQWNPLLERLLDRLTASGPHRPILEQSLKELGNRSDKEKRENLGHWHWLHRPGRRGHYGHALPDLIAVWEYAQLLDYALSDYQEGE